MRNVHSIVTTAEALDIPVDFAPRTNGPRAQEEQYVPIAKESAMINLTAQVPEAPNTYHHRRGTQRAKVKGKVKTARAKAKARVRAATFPEKDLAMYRCLTQRVTQRRTGMRGVISTNNNNTLQPH